jgi:plasmid stabilization system protein ParE
LGVLFLKLEETLSLIAQNPNLFQVSDEKKETRRVVILKHNTLYYRCLKNQIEIISFFSDRQSPIRRKLK